MDWLTFIAEIIKAVAWPSTMLLILFNFKKEISRLFLRISKFKHKDTEIDFAEGVEKLVVESEAQGQEIAPPEKDAPLHAQYEMLTRLAEISPRAAVIEAFRVIEIAIFDKLPGNLKDSINNHHRAVRILYENKLLGEQDYYQLRQLRNLRNTAAHSEDFSLKGMPIEAYIDIALTVASHIREAQYVR